MLEKYLTLINIPHSLEHLKKKINLQHENESKFQSYIIKSIVAMI